MSGFERALLEGKDRDELSQIAESLGKKPPARMKKADMVELILELAGVSSDSPGEVRSPADDGPAAGGNGAQGDGRPATQSVGQSGNGSRAREARDPDERAGKAVGGRDGVDDEGVDDVGVAEAGGAETGETGVDEAPAVADANNQNQGGQQPGGQARGDQDQDDGEEGNRRRRRGRNRNRDGQPEQFEGEPVEVEGLLDLRDDGYGFLRLQGYLASSQDVYVSVKQVRQFGLRKGDRVKGKSRPASRSEKNPALLQIDAINGSDPGKARDRRRFEELTPLFPDERLQLETNDASNMTTRIIDLLAPIGKGQRGLIVSPPKAGKTTVMKQIARSIETNAPDVVLIVLLVDERPEEVTDMKRWLRHGEVAASTFDRPSEEHIHVAELVIERAKRLVEDGSDVVIILDGITRLARAYNLAQPPSGRIMSGGIDAGALYPPKKFFGAARNAEEGGSLTILATALVETGSKMDEHIFEEFKGTGNMELKLDRRLADRRIFPAIDIDASSTRHEELLFERRQVPQVTTLRRVLGAVKDGDGASDAAALELLVDRMRAFPTNADFLAEIAKAKTVSG